MYDIHHLLENFIFIRNVTRVRMNVVFEVGLLLVDALRFFSPGDLGENNFYTFDLFYKIYL